jgi:hypothetical protein
MFTITRTRKPRWQVVVNSRPAVEPKQSSTAWMLSLLASSVAR